MLLIPSLFLFFSGQPLFFLVFYGNGNLLAYKKYIKCEKEIKVAFSRIEDFIMFVKDHTACNFCQLCALGCVNDYTSLILLILEQRALVSSSTFAKSAAFIDHLRFSIVAVTLFTIHDMFANKFVESDFFSIFPLN